MKNKFIAWKASVVQCRHSFTLLVLTKEDITPDERIEVETLCALGIELIKSESSYKLREAGRLVELRFRLSSKNAL